MALVDLILSNLRGTRQSSFRIKPASTSGAPTFGSYDLGELYVDAIGDYYKCIATGTPGTWVKLSDTANNVDALFSMVGF